MLQASTAASIRMTIVEKVSVNTNRYMKTTVITTETKMAVVGVWRVGDMEPSGAGATRSNDQATIARTPKVCMPGIHIHIQNMNPRETRMHINAEPVKIGRASWRVRT